MLHLAVGMHTVPVTVKKREEGSIDIESEKPIGYAPEDIFLALDLNAKKNRVVGKCRLEN
jgi:hypothetical protein